MILYLTGLEAALLELGIWFGGAALIYWAGNKLFPVRSCSCGKEHSR